MSVQCVGHTVWPFLLYAPSIIGLQVTTEHSEVIRRKTPSTKSKDEITFNSDAPCGQDCYKHFLNEDSEESFSWVPQAYFFPDILYLKYQVAVQLEDIDSNLALQELKTILEITPDLTSCDLGLFADMTCRRVCRAHFCESPLFLISFS